MPDRVIRSERLDLISLTPEFYEASLFGNKAGAARMLGLVIPDEWFAAERLMEMRLGQLRADPSLQPWLLRAVALRAEGVMVGRIGFHTAPDPAYLKEIALGAVEFGYAIFSAWRRCGYAREAAVALMRWAYTEHHVERFVLSISPANVASLALARQLGFVRVGSQVDDEDGVEDIYLKQRGADDDDYPGL